MELRRGKWISSLALLSLLAVPVLAEPSIPGAEQRVNERQNLTQRHPVAAFSAAGNALVVWENDLVGLQGRLYSRDGSPAGPELTLVANQVFTTVPAAGEVILRKDAAIAMLPSGAFLLFWTEEQGFVRADYFIYNYELHSRAVVGQLFDSSGRPAGERFRVGAGEAGAFHSAPQVSVRGNDVAVAWSLDDRIHSDKAVLLRLFDHRGRATTGEVRVSPAGEAATFPAIAAAANGRLLVAWEGPDSDNGGIVGQLLDPAASPVGSAFRINADAAGRQRRPALAPAGADGFLATWNGEGQVRGANRIFGQLVGAAGNLVGGQLAISSGAVEKELVPALAPGRNGHFLAAWLGYRSIFPVGIFAVELDADGSPIGEPVKLNRRALGANRVLSVAGDGKGGFLIPWEGFIRRKAGISVQRVSQP